MICRIVQGIVAAAAALALIGCADNIGRQADYIKLTQSAEPPVIPVGLDGYLMWDRLPYQRIGIRAYMRSTYDRKGNNHAADASHFLYQQSDEFNVTLDTKGPGVLYFVRTNHWHGSPWHYEIDGNDFLVRETATADPVNAKKVFNDTTFIPQELFPNPLTWTWSITKGADLMWVPLAFENSLRIAYTRTFYGTGYYIYHIFSPGIENLSRPLKSWNKQPPDPQVLTLINSAGTDIAPKGPDVTTLSGLVDLRPNQTRIIAKLDDGPSVIRAIKFTVSREQSYNFGNARLRITWDGRKYPSIDAPVALFFGAGHLYNNNDREYLVKGFPSVIRYDRNNVELSCYWPMPFFRGARIDILNEQNTNLRGISWEIRTVPYTDPVNHAAYFHATYTDHPVPVPGYDNTFLDTATVEGGGLWSGNFVGMSWIFTRRGRLQTLEGDPRFLFDDSNTPQGWGTGTEEWGGGGDYWGGRNMTIPFAGYPVGAEAKNAKDKQDLLNSAYRFLIADIFPFGRRAVIRLEHGGVNEANEHYSGVVYWYGIDSPALVVTDQLSVCDEQDIRSHEYSCNPAGRPYALISRYELGPDHFGSKEIFPAEEDLVRATKGTSEFKVRLDPDNLGVMLRRKFDYIYPNQRAKVWVRAEGASDWQYAGQWYTAGSNTCVYSNPQETGELGATKHNIITSNRQWRQEEFLIPRRLTAGVARLEVKFEFVPDKRELFPGQPFEAESAWSESRYWVYCYKMPTVTLK
jgi:hypothetical protein